MLYVVYAVQKLFNSTYQAAEKAVNKMKNGTSIVKALRAEIDRCLGDNDHRWKAVNEIFTYNKGEWGYELTSDIEEAYNSSAVKSCMSDKGEEVGLLYAELGCEVLMVLDRDEKVMARTIVRNGRCLPAKYAADGAWAARLEAAMAMCHLTPDASLFDGHVVPKLKNRIDQSYTETREVYSSTLLCYAVDKGDGVYYKLPFFAPGRLDEISFTETSVIAAADGLRFKKLNPKSNVVEVLAITKIKFNIKHKIVFDVDVNVYVDNHSEVNGIYEYTPR